MGIFEFGVNRKFVQEWVTVFGDKYSHFVLLLPIALVIAFFSGFDDGKTGNRFFTKAVENEIVFNCGQKPIRGSISLSVGAFVLVHQKTGDERLPVLIPKEDIAQIHKFVSNDPVDAKVDTTSSNPD